MCDRRVAHGFHRPQVRPDAIFHVANLLHLGGCDVKAQTDSTVTIGVMAPLHWVSPVLAEAQQTHIFGKGALHMLVSRACFRIPRRDLQKFEWIV